MSVYKNFREFVQRKRQIRDGWIIASLIMLALPLGGKLVLALFYTFMAFAYLDEKPYEHERKHAEFY